jgi:NADP-dependent 3-hydroxy acid dehydrogenase YdfG
METAKTWLGSFTYPTFDISYSFWGFDLKLSHKLIYALAAIGAWTAFKSFNSLNSTLASCLLTREQTQLTRGDASEDFFVKTVVIVGGDTLIGKAFARELAQRNFTLVLLGQDEAALEAVATELGTKEGVIVRTLKYSLLTDWSSLSQFEADLVTLLKPLNVTGIVNAELEAEPSGSFHNIKLNDIIRVLGAQVVAPTIATKVAVARMELVNTKGFVLSVTSGLVTKPCSKRPLFGAAACYSDYLSQSLARSYSSRIKFHSVRQLLGEDLSDKDCDRFVKNSLKWVGIKTILYGGFLQSMKSCAYAGVLHHFN